ncbi:MAG TPA: STAS domain-containing protein [Terriglobia bacterium]|nr:STAS domain-containing protein [Terriglobia bacterium]
MLKITIHEDGQMMKLVVEGKLAGNSVSELEATWRQTRQGRQSGRIVVDLSGVTHIDATGEVALCSMIADGARLIVKGLYNEPLVEDIRCRAGYPGSSRSTHRRRNRDPH